METTDHGDVPVVPVASPDDAVGLKMRDLHERGLACDFIDIAAIGDLYSFRELERLARPHTPGFSLAELVMRLEFVDHIDDADFAAHGVTEDRLHDIRRFAHAWAEDIKLRRGEEGDLDGPDFDLPPID